MLSKFNFQIKLIIGSALFFCATAFLVKPKAQPFNPYLLPLPTIKYFSVGLKIQLADVLWLRVIENSDYCEQKVNQNQCIGKSWLYQNLDLATDLDVAFEKDMYRLGGLALSIIISDIEGATNFYAKGIKQYSSYWPLLYEAAYHACFEEKNKVKAADLYFRAAKNGAPDWVHVMAGRLAAEGGEYEYAEKILQTMIETNQDEKYISRLKEKLQALKK